MLMIQEHCTGANSAMLKGTWKEGSLSMDEFEFIFSFNSSPLPPAVVSTAFPVPMKASLIFDCPASAAVGVFRSLCRTPPLSSEELLLLEG